MNNIRIIKTEINVSKIKKQLESNSRDWGQPIPEWYEGNLETENIQMLDPQHHIVSTGVLQLVMGGIQKPDEFVGDTEICIKTKAYKNHTEIINFLKRNFKNFKRCGFLALPVGNIVDFHIDEGSYYLTKDRYHLSIQGIYEYFVGDEKVIVEPGTLLWFNNKLPHKAVNIGNETRITFVFDVPHNKKNP